MNPALVCLCFYFIFLLIFFLCVCICRHASDVRLDHAQQGFVPGRLHRDRQQPPPCCGAANPAQPLRHELHGETHTDSQQEIMLFFPLGLKSVPCTV